MSKPPAGSYPIALGDSFVGQKQFHLLKYDFKPASIDPTSVGELELRSDLSASLLLPQKAQTLTPGEVGCVEFAGSVSKKTAEESAPTCLLLFDPDTNSFTIERVETAAILKQVVRDTPADAATARKRKLLTPATMQRRAEMAAKRPMAAAPIAPVVAAASTSTSAGGALVSNAAAASPIAAPAPVRPPAPPSQRPLVHLTSGRTLTPEESMAAEFAEDDGMDVSVHVAALDAAPISLTQLLDPTTQQTSAASAATARPAPAAPAVSMDFSFMGADALKAAAAAGTVQPAPAASASTAAAVDPIVAGASFPSSTSHDSVCSFCRLPVAIDPTDSHCDTDSETTNADKERRRDYLHCDSCLKFAHKKCVADTTPSAATAAGRPWSCPDCA